MRADISWEEQSRKTVGPKEPQGRFYWFSLTRLPARKCGSRSQWLSAKWNACVSIWWEQRLRTYPPQHALGPDTVGATTKDLSAPACTGTWHGGSNDWGLIRPSMHWDLTQWEQRLRTYPPQHALGPDSGFIAPAQRVGAGFIADFLLLGCLGDPASGGGRLCSCGTIFA